MKNPSDVFKSIRYAKMEPKHDKGHAGGSTDDEEHGAIGEKEWAEQLKHAKKRAMMNTEEVKDKTDIGEYDQEGDMAKSDLRSIMANAKRLHDMIEDADNLPEWCQNKITLAEDYISTVTNYMTAEMDESIQEATSAAVRLQRALQREKEKRERSERLGAALLRPKPQETPMKKEEVVAEGLSDTQQKIQDTINKLEDRLKHAKTPEQWDNIKNRIERLQAGLKRSKQGVAKGLQEREDDEYHTPTRHHVQVQVSKGDGPKQYRKATVRAKEPDHAVSAAIVHYKQQGYTVHDHKYLGEDVEQIDEGRPSQRHPLEGHEYHKKTNAELEYIAKDAHKAAEAMKSHNTTAENKYRDQANDSATVRYYRQKHGMADWYKKKYGHIKEDIDEDYCPDCIENPCACNNQIDEIVKGDLKNDIKVLDSTSFFKKHGVKKGQAKNMEETVSEAYNTMSPSSYDDHPMVAFRKKENEKPPFDGPYKKTKGTVTDKSGAKHGPMSIARNLARQALKKQASKMSVKESLDESRKTDIVKEAFKKAKKKNDETFQSEPELGSTVVKADN